ncbi:crossover junction endodeoxyribonuclease RuvC [Candidatus Oleimmundimicrobium sp.]|uniref:crossover junction endodeoxyribonuclease RuvC n=1 Tax=Candidatus Oleimmundimicrobium sp. TaxID=3060597 RepID=UPI00271AD25E|nr:crossover junction endodeoxyribonuclease RuvC [Candidatus Oleimmundimicrobium sp.]MDO8886706.1 crossover junction endodeoxyribonuclease RuvC [Candidatus Oleimmundimicrobium sp.]
MIILGLDPGLAITGFGVIDCKGNRLKPISYGCIRTEAKLSLPVRLDKVFKEMEILINKYNPQEVAVESLFFNSNAKTVFAVGQARGVALLAMARAGLPVSDYTPLQVKQAVVGYGRADKLQVQNMVKTLLCLSEYPKPDDAADALAIAICHAHSRKMNRVGNEE